MVGNLFRNFFVNEVSDGVCVFRYLEVRKKVDGNVILVGEGWDLNVKCWYFEEVKFFRKDEEKGDKDDFIVFKCYIDKVVEKDFFVKMVLIYNLNCIIFMEKFFIIYCLWLIIDKGYIGKYFFNYW